MIDLSYLTEEEQGMILSVLKRDTELKNLEEERIKQLRKTEKDRSRLKYLTGEWFYEYHRHRDRIHGTDIISASMRQRKPVTILELSQRWAERPSCVNREKKDVFIPPELLGLIEEPSTQPRNYRVGELLEARQEGQRPQIKPRQNPFNSMRSQRDADWRTNGVKEANQTPTEDHYVLHAEPQSTEVSNFHATAEITGKAIQPGAGCQAHKVTEEEGRSITKLLEWFGRGSRDGTLKKHKKSPVQREKNEEETKDHGTSDAKSEDFAPPIVQPKTKPSPKPRRGLFALFSRAEKKDEGLEVVVSDKEVTSQDTKENSTSECQTPCILKPEANDNVVLQDERKMTEILQVTSKAEDGNKPVCEDGSHREMFDYGEISPGRLSNLKSFWERGNTGSKILSLKKEAEIQESKTSLLNENDHNASERRLLDSSIRPSQSKPSDPVESTPSEMSTLSSNEDGKHSDLDSNKISEGSSKLSKLQTDMVKTDVRKLVSPSLLLKHKDNTPGNELQEEAPVESLSKDISNLKKEISPFSHQKNKVSINDLSSSWEKEKTGLRESVDSSLESSPQRSSIELSNSQPDIRSDTPDLMSSLDRKSSPLDKDVGLIVKPEKIQEKQSPGRMPEQDHQDVRGREPCTAQYTSNLKPQPSAPSPLRSLSAKGENDNQQSTDIYKSKDQNQTPSPLRQPKVPPRDSYPNKESRMDGSPLRTFVIDINPSACIVKGRQVHEEMPLCSFNLVNEKIGKNNWPEGNRMSPPQDSSELFTIPPDNSPFHPTAATSQVLASGQPFTSLENGKTLEEGTDMRPLMPKERKLSTDYQSNARLARSYIPLSLQHYLGIPEQTVLDERERLEQVKVQAVEVSKQGNPGKVSNESSPSGHSQSDSEEITFDSSGSSTPEAWSLSHTSSACDSEEDTPVIAALERANARPISISRSLEDLVSDPSLSAVTPNTKASFSDPEQMKMMSMSVPAFIHQEIDYRNSDCASVSSFHFDRLRTCNASSTLSVCSEAASMSSVTGSVMSINSSEFGNVEVKGTIQFAIHYMQKLGEFHIFVVQCKDLAVADPKRNRSDPYVKCYLLPDKANYGKRKTCVRKKTLDPTYNEILRYKIPMETLKTQKLNLSVWHNDTFGHNSFLGEVEIDLAEWDFHNTQMNDYLLKGRVQVPPSPKHSACSEEMRAEMRVALRFLPQTSHSHKNKVNGEVQIWVKECRNLPISRGVSIDPFVKCTILPDSSRKSRQKTRVLKRASNPVFNHTIVYDGFRPEDLKEASVELTVWDHDRLHSHFVGGIRLGPGTGKSYGADVDWMDSNSTEAALWERMMQSHNEWVEGVLPLRMLVMARMSR